MVSSLVEHERIETTLARAHEAQVRQPPGVTCPDELAKHFRVAAAATATPCVRGSVEKHGAEGAGGVPAAELAVGQVHAERVLTLGKRGELLHKRKAAAFLRGDYLVHKVLASGGGAGRRLGAVCKGHNSK